MVFMSQLCGFIYRNSTGDGKPQYLLHHIFVPKLNIKLKILIFESIGIVPKVDENVY